MNPLEGLFKIINETQDRTLDLLNGNLENDLDSHDCGRPDGCQCDQYDDRD